MSTAPSAPHTDYEAMSRDTKHRIIEATVATIKEEGITGTSARAIARRGDFNQALIFYHFGSIEELLRATMEHTSSARIELYRSRLEKVESLADLAAVAGDLHREDRESGNMTLLTQLMAGAATDDVRAQHLMKTFEPWIDFVKETLERLAAKSPFVGMFNMDDIAFTISALFVGIELMSDLDPERSRDSVYNTLQLLAAAFQGLLGETPDEAAPLPRRQITVE